MIGHTLALVAGDRGFLESKGNKRIKVQSLPHGVGWQWLLALPK
jgi:hypothetical protein